MSFYKFLTIEDGGAWVELDQIGRESDGGEEGFEWLRAQDTVLRI